MGCTAWPPTRTRSRTFSTPAISPGKTDIHREDLNMTSQASWLRDVGAALLILGLSLAGVTVAKADEPVSPPNSPDRSFRPPPPPPGWQPHLPTPDDLGFLK